MSRKEWVFPSHDKEKIKALADAAMISPLLSQLLYNRGICSLEAVALFLEGEFADLSSPYALYNMGAAVARIEAAIDAEEKIVVYGDYDVDGICAAVLLSEMLTAMGAKTDVYVPSRLKEGYGLNDAALENLLQAGVSLVITVDNGIAAAEIIERFYPQRLDFIVTDHHQLPEKLPPCMTIDPLLEPEEEAPFRGLCGAGVAFMLGLALWQHRQPTWLSPERLSPFLQLAALATIADMVPLHGDNRILVKAGLAEMQERPRPAISALAEVAGLSTEHISSETVAFQFAPRINACGRLDEVSVAIALLQAEGKQATALAVEADEMNKRRKKLEQDAFDEACQQLEGRVQAGIVVYNEHWHSGVVGIVASRLLERFAVPVVVLTRKKDCPDAFSGSARAPEGFHIYEAFRALQGHLLAYGGHEKAAGLSLHAEALPAFSDAFQAYCDRSFLQWYGLERHVVDAVVQADAINWDFWSDLVQLEPTGYANPKPTFVLENQKNVEMKVCGAEKNHLQIQVGGTDFPLQGIAFRRADYARFAKQPRHDLLFQLSMQSFRGQERLQMMVQDMRPAYESDDALSAELFGRTDAMGGEVEYDGIEHRQAFFSKLAGVSFADRQARIGEIAPGDALFLQREKHNPVDALAIAVYHKKGQLGYLKRGLAARLAPLIDAGKAYDVKVSQVTGGGDRRLGVNVYLSRQSTPAATAPREEGPEPVPKKTSEVAQMMIDGQALTPSQSEALMAVEAGQNVLAVLGTGQGKSLLYQASAVSLAVHKKKMTVVFFPLRALLFDQFVQTGALFSRFGLSLFRAYGDLNGHERMLLERALTHGEVDVVFTTPEFFLAHEQLFRQGPRPVGLFVFDEAHHLSDRRPAYRRLPAALAQYPQAQRLALTATVPMDGRTRIVEALDIEAVVFDARKRKNLLLVDRRGEGRKTAYLYQVLIKREKSVVYVNSRRQAMDIAAHLRVHLPHRLRSRVAYFHGGLSQHLRNRLVDAFRSGEVLMMIATTAFGEGINIPNIRHVIHYHLPFSKESFNQLSGRAGRNGETAYIHLLYGKKDQALNELILDASFPSRQELGRIYKLLQRRSQETDAPLGSWAELSEDIHERFRVRILPEALAMAVRIFDELGFMVRPEKEAICCRVKENPERKELGTSELFQEGHYERAAFETFVEMAFTRDQEQLTATMRKPVCPAELCTQQPLNAQGGD